MKYNGNNLLSDFSCEGYLLQTGRFYNGRFYEGGGNELKQNSTVFLIILLRYSQHDNGNSDND